MGLGAIRIPALLDDATRIPALLDDAIRIPALLDGSRRFQRIRKTHDIDARARRRRYARGGLALDLITRLPWDYLLPAISHPDMAEESCTQLGCYSYAHLVRLLLLGRAADLVSVGAWGDLNSGQLFVSTKRQLAVLCGVSMVFIHW